MTAPRLLPKRTMSHNAASLQTLVRERVDAWEAGQSPDTACFVDEYPELRDAKSLVKHLLLVEYELKRSIGESPKIDSLCNSFPEYRHSLAKLFEVQAELDRMPAFEATQRKASWPAPGEDFLGFRLIEPLGVGGLARVFLARELCVGNRLVVVKISPLSHGEAQTLGKLSHSSIVPIHSVTHDRDRDWTLICMPLLGVATGVDLLDRAFRLQPQREGILLRQTARETRPLEPIVLPEATESFLPCGTYEESIALAGWQLASALTAAHAAGVMHRDIKPSNVLLAWSGRAMLLDFNLSTDAAAQFAGVGGTLTYMAPERIAALRDDDATAARAFEPTSDIYSLGVVLYELLTGVLPAKPSSAERLALDAYEDWLACKAQPIIAPSTLQPTIDRRLEAIVLKCLALNPRDRYSTAAALADDLKTYLSRTAQLARFAKRNRRALLLATAASLVSATGFGIYVGNRPSSLELLYQRGLDEYNAGKFDDAVDTFTRCIELEPGSPRALFGRGQAYRRLERFAEARTDFTGLRKASPIWSQVLAAHCDIKLRDEASALGRFMGAHRSGLRHTDFLMDFARTELNRFRYANAADIYSQVIEREPQNIEAHRNRMLAYVSWLRNDPKRLPDEGILRALTAYCALDTSLEAPSFGALLFGDATLKDSTYRDQGAALLTIALKKGLPQESLKMYQKWLRPLFPAVDASLIDAARSDPSWRLEAVPLHAPPLTADWNDFHNQVGASQ